MNAENAGVPRVRAESKRHVRRRRPSPSGAAIRARLRYSGIARYVHVARVDRYTASRATPSATYATAIATRRTLAQLSGVLSHSARRARAGPRERHELPLSRVERLRLSHGRRRGGRFARHGARRSLPPDIALRAAAQSRKRGFFYRSRLW